MIIRVDAGSALPVYEQICDQVIRMVVAGTLLPGTRMPTIRQLANDLRLAKGTVAKAYSQLEEARVLETFGHRGTFIAAAPTSPRSPVASVDDALHASADVYLLAAHQLGVGLERAHATLDERWGRLTVGDPA